MVLDIRSQIEFYIFYSQNGLHTGQQVLLRTKGCADSQASENLQGIVSNDGL